MQDVADAETAGVGRAAHLFVVNEHLDGEAAILARGAAVGNRDGAVAPATAGRKGMWIVRRPGSSRSAREYLIIDRLNGGR